MRLADIKTIEDANKFVYEDYIPDHSRRFGDCAKKAVDVHRPLTDDLQSRLPAIFSIQSKRKVHNDYTIQFKTFWFQLEAKQKTTVYKRDTVIVEERLDGTTHIRLKGVYLDYRVLPLRPKHVRIPVAALTARKPDWKPPTTHPWKKFKFGKNSPRA